MVAEPTFEARILSVGPEPALALIGDLDAAAAPAWEDVEAFARTHAAVTLDLTDLAFIDSRGLSLLIGLSERGSRALTLKAPQTNVARLLHLAGIEHLFTIA